MISRENSADDREKLEPKQLSVNLLKAKKEKLGGYLSTVNINYQVLSGETGADKSHDSSAERSPVHRKSPTGRLSSLIIKNKYHHYFPVDGRHFRSKVANLNSKQMNKQEYKGILNVTQGPNLNK